MSSKNKKNKSGVVVMCVFLTIALILAGCIGVGFYFKSNDPDMYNAFMDKLRGAEPTEPSEVALEMPTSAKIEETAAEQTTEDYDVSFTVTEEFAEMIGTGNLAKAKAKTNDDGSVTYTMKNSDHVEMMDKLEKTIESEFKDKIISGEFKDVTSINHNDDFTDIVIETDKANAYGELDAYFITIEICTLSRLYQNLDGKDEQVVDMRFVDPDGNEYFKQHYPTEE